MKKIVIKGNKKLSGKISISGSKNAALPIIFSCILIKGVSEIENLPDIGDVRIALKILEYFGAKISCKEGITYIDTTSLVYRDPPDHFVEKIRASTYLLGSCLSRFARCRVMRFGGCNFSLRPIDMHIDAAVSYGARFDGNSLIAERLYPTEIYFKKASVGATVNAIIIGSAVKGKTLLHGCAIEPHIDALIEFLNSAGANIIRRDREIEISGSELSGGKIKIIGDMIEAGSYLALGALCGDVEIDNAPIEDMTSIFHAFNRLGVSFFIDENQGITTKVSNPRRATIIADPYPAFPTDLQPIFAPLMAAFCGGEITDNVWSGRFGYLDALSKFGLKYEREANAARIYPSSLHSAVTEAPDLRGGMAALLCALKAEGISEIYSADRILRGYEDLEQKLSAVGAEIKIEGY